MQIVGIALVRNEDLYIERVLRNVLGFCDRVIVADHQSTDWTASIVRRLALEDSRIELHRIADPSESHDLIRGFAGTDTWVFGVDGDEVYDPGGLARLRVRLAAGEFAPWWVIFGNVLNCTKLDVPEATARGYLSPPSRSMTKLYNFNAIESWDGRCDERLHGGTLRFKAGYSAALRHKYHAGVSWEASEYRCLHLCFLRRSSRDAPTRDDLHTRLNLVEQGMRSPLDWLRKIAFGGASLARWKRDKYMRGELVVKDVGAFWT